jgi:hypothetical protein
MLKRIHSGPTVIRTHAALAYSAKWQEWAGHVKNRSVDRHSTRGGAGNNFVIDFLIFGKDV